MREQFKEIKNGCPWLDLESCAAMRTAYPFNDCHYKNCAILYWLRQTLLRNAPELLDGSKTGKT